MDENKENGQIGIKEEAEDAAEENRQVGDKRWGIFMIIVLIGFALIYFLVTRGYARIAAHFGWKESRALALMLVAFFWYIWGQVCIFIKNEHNID